MRGCAMYAYLIEQCGVGLCHGSELSLPLRWCMESSDTIELPRTFEDADTDHLVLLIGMFLLLFSYYVYTYLPYGFSFIWVNELTPETQ